jgi:transcriptional regulator with XRE-family HTH domain
MMHQYSLYCNERHAGLMCLTMGQTDLNDEWPAQWSKQIGTRLQRYRKAAKLSASALSERCSEAGYPIPRSTIANLESGRKEAVPVHEVVVLAKALAIPPLALLYGIDEAGEVDVLPDLKASGWDAWIRFADGLSPFNSIDNADNREPLLTIRETLLHYGLIAGNAKAWRRVQELLSRYEELNRDNTTLRSELQREMEQILADTFGALDFLRSRGLPLPDVPSDWLQALSENDAKIIALEEEDHDA